MKTLKEKPLFNVGDKVIHIYTGKELTVVNNVGFTSVTLNYIPCADKDNYIDDYCEMDLRLNK